MDVPLAGGLVERGIDLFGDLLREETVNHADFVMVIYGVVIRVIKVIGLVVIVRINSDRLNAFFCSDQISAV